MEKYTWSSILEVDNRMFFILALLFVALIVVLAFVIHPILGVIVVIYFILSSWRAVDKNKKNPIGGDWN